MNRSHLVIGIGSAHGDDQFGWLVADSLSAESRPEFTVKRARAPADILSWLEGASTLTLCDGCRGTGLPGTLRRWNWPNAEIPSTTFLGTHDLGLVSVLELAQRLQAIPAQVWIWGAEARHCAPGANPTDEIRQAAKRAAEEIRKELCPK